jgi:hypothetical protein
MTRKIVPGMTEMKTLEVGDVYRDKYGDSPTYRNPRKIRVTEVYPYGIRAEVIVHTDGKPPSKQRFTTLNFYTLKSAYVFWEAADATNS